MDSMLCCAGLMLNIKAMITDQRLLVAAFHAADLRQGGKCLMGLFLWYTGKKVSVHHKDKFNGQRSLVTNSNQPEQEGKSLYRQR